MPQLIIFKLVVLVVITKTHTIVGKLLGRKLNGPLDRGVVFVDGRPILEVRRQFFRSWQLLPALPYLGSQGRTVSSSQVLR